MTSLYVAGPMTGYPDQNYPAFHDAGARLTVAGYTVLNPVDNEAENPHPGTVQPWPWYMRRALRQVLAADAVAVLPGWDASRGANLEVSVAQQLGMPCAPIDHWLGARGAWPAACARCALPERCRCIIPALVVPAVPIPAPAAWVAERERCLPLTVDREYLDGWLCAWDAAERFMRGRAGVARP